MNVGNAQGSYQDLGLGLPEQEKKKTGKGELGQEEFLELMTTQLKNQDPFKPMENGDFIAQMAQFGTVSGIQELQNNVKDMTATMQADSVSKATSLVGRNVLVKNDLASLAETADGGQALKGAVDVPNAVSNLQVSIKRLNGEQVATLNLGEQGSGMTEFAWDGKAADGSQLQPGTYRFVAEGKVGNQTESFQTYAGDRVNSVTLGDGNNLKVNLSGLGDVSLADITRVAQ